MSNQEFNIKRGDTSPALEARLDGPDDITGANVSFHMAAATADDPTVDDDAVIESASPPEVKYEWVEGDTAEAGRYLAEFEVEYADGATETFPNTGYIVVVVEADLA